MPPEFLSPTRETADKLPMRGPCPAGLPRRLPRPEASEAHARRAARCLQEYE
jgi:hypothetical protein